MTTASNYRRYVSNVWLHLSCVRGLSRSDAGSHLVAALAAFAAPSVPSFAATFAAGSPLVHTLGSAIQLRLLPVLGATGPPTPAPLLSADVALVTKIRDHWDNHDYQ